MDSIKVNDFTLEQLCDGVKKTIDSVPTILNNPKYKDYIRIVLIGNTGVGKSTLVHILAGDKMKVVFTDEDMLFTCPDTKIPQIVIGAGLKSVTVIPAVYVDDNNKLIFIDTPGLLDSEGVFQRILNAYSIHTVLKAGGKMKILFVMDRQAFYSKKGKNTIDNFDIISQLVPDENILKQCITLAITKTRSDDEIKGFFDYLKSGEENELPWLIDYLMDEEKNKIFMVPEAEDEGDYNKFTDFDAVFNILKNDPAESPENKIVVDQDCIDQMKILAKQLKNQSINAIENFKMIIPPMYENEKNLTNLEQLNKKMSQLLDAAKQGLNQFGQQVLKIFPNNSKEINESIDKMKPWRNFLIEIMDDDTVNENLYVDLSSLIDCLSGHLNNIIQLEKEHQENAAHLNQMDAKMNAENTKYAKDVNDLETKAKNNEISQEEKQKKLNQLHQNHEKQSRKINMEKSDFEKKSQASMDCILNAIKQQNEESKKKLNGKIQEIKDNINNLQRENAVLQCKLEYERLERERIEKENERQRIEREEKIQRQKAKIAAQRREINNHRQNQGGSGGRRCNIQ